MLPSQLRQVALFENDAWLASYEQTREKRWKKSDDEADALMRQVWACTPWTTLRALVAPSFMAIPTPGHLLVVTALVIVGPWIVHLATNRHPLRTIHVPGARARYQRTGKKPAWPGYRRGGSAGRLRRPCGDTASIVLGTIEGLRLVTTLSEGRGHQPPQRERHGTPDLFLASLPARCVARMERAQCVGRPSVRAGQRRLLRQQRGRGHQAHRRRPVQDVPAEWITQHVGHLRAGGDEHWQWRWVCC